MSADIKKPTARLTDLLDADGHPKIAPVQGYNPGIPWSLHLEAYDAYCKKYGGQEALIDLAGRGCRGGFGVGELDTFIPGWRDKVSEIGKLRAKVAELEAALVVSKQVVEYEQRHAAESEVALANYHAVVSEGQAVARLLHWKAPAHIPVPHGGVCARTYVEFPKNAGDDGYWKEGAPLYDRPAAPAPEAPTKESK